MDRGSQTEASRQALLRMLDVLDTAPEPAFDALIRCASRVCRCPISLMSLIDVDRQWFKAAVGLEATETPRDQAFCAHAIRQDTLFEVPDAAADPRFAQNPLVTDGPHIRFYAGQPILFEGVALGTICVIDQVPRTLDDEQRAFLADLALAAAELLTGRMQAKLHRQEARRLQDFAQMSGDWLWETDLLQRCSWLSGDSSKASGLFRGTILGGRFHDAKVHDWAGRPIPGPGLHALMKASQPFSNVLVRTSTSQGPRFIALSATPILDDAGAMTGHRGSARDVTDRIVAEIESRTAHEASRTSERRLRDITDNLPVLISHIDQDERFTYVNDAFRSWMGKEATDLVGRKASEAIGSALYRQRSGYFARCLRGERLSFDIESSIHGETKFLQGTYLPDVDADGRVVGATCLSVDVTDLKKAEHRLMQLAHYDVLTGLPNRLRFNEELDLALQSETDARSMAVMFLDIDHFKAINDTHGHAVGDAVLQAFANRLARSVRATDFVARLAGDEFVVVLRDLSHSDEARAVARKVVEHVGRPFTAKGVTVDVTTSVGVAIKDGSAVDRAQILAKADAALYEAKQAGRNTFRLAA